MPLSRERRVAAITIGILLMLVATGCTGPRGPLVVGIKEYPTDVTLGGQSIGEPVAPTSISAPPRPAFIQAPPPRPEGAPVFGAPTVRIKCPAAHPFDAPRFEATNRATAPPEPASFIFRNKGSFEISGAYSAKGSFPPESGRTIQNIQRTDSDYSFDVSAEQLGTSSTTTYRVIPESSLPGQAGIFVVQIKTRGPDGSTSEFTPTPGLKLLQFPAEPGTSWDTAGSDTSSRTFMTFQATIPGRLRVDACGSVLDSWGVAVRNGRIVSPNRDVSFSATYAIATQFGGFSVFDKVSNSGREGGTNVSSTNEATISSEPKRP